MTRNLFLTATLLSLATGAAAYAQQPDPAPATPPAPIVRPDRAQHGPDRPMQRPMQQKMGRDQGPGPGGHGPESRLGPPGMWWKNSELIQKLTITPEQQTKMDGIFQQARIQLIDLKANVEKQDVILEPMLAANTPDTNKVLSQIDKIAQARAELEKANARMLLGLRAVLTPDQWTKLQAERGIRHDMHKGDPEGMNPSPPARDKGHDGHGPNASLNQDLNLEFGAEPAPPAPAI